MDDYPFSVTYPFSTSSQFSQIPVMSPEDVITVCLVDECLEDMLTPPAVAAAQRGGGSKSKKSHRDGGARLSQRLRIPHFDKRFCCDREVALTMSATGAGVPAPEALAAMPETKQPRRLG